MKGKTSFDASFGKSSGTYRAVYESILDPRDSTTGEFLVARFRYSYFKAIEAEANRPRYDESISEVLLDCPNHMAGTAKLTYKLGGVVVREVVTPAAEVLMMQSSEPSTVTDLCAFVSKRGAARQR